MVACAVAMTGCSKDEGKTAPAASASAANAASAIPSATASAPAPSAAASAAPPVDCPKGTAGDGTFLKPCIATGKARMMEVSWNGKTDDKGPFFRVANKSTGTILYGKIAVYFYDKTGKAITVKDTSATPPKDKPFLTCGGNMFQGVMKAGEKAVIQFSCVRKEDVPDGVAAIEAEMQMVGYTDESEKKFTYYWQNPDLTPDTRKKGGVK
jgi:hypothetical protein